MSLGIPLNLQPFSGVNQEYVNRLNQYAQQVMPYIHYRCPKGYSHYVNQLNLPADPSAFGLNWNIDREGHLCYPSSGKLPGTSTPSLKNIIKAAQMAQAVSAVTGQQLTAEQLQALMAVYKGGKKSRSRSRSPSVRALAALGLDQSSGIDSASLRAQLAGVTNTLQQQVGLSAGAAAPTMTAAGAVTQEAVDLAAKIVQAAEQSEAKKEQENQAADIIKLTKIVKKHNPLTSVGDAAAQAMTMYSESQNCAQYIGKPGECDASGECHLSANPNSKMCMPKSLYDRQLLANQARDAKKESTELNSWFRSYNSKQRKIGYGTMAPEVQAAEVAKVAAILQKYREANVDVSGEAESIVSSASVCSTPDGLLSGNCAKLSLDSSVAYPTELMQRRDAVDAASSVISQTSDLNAWYRSFHAKARAKNRK